MSEPTAASGLLELAQKVVAGEPGARETLVADLGTRGWTVDLESEGPVDPVRLLAAMSAAPEWDDDDKLRLLSDLAEQAIGDYFAPAYPEDTRPASVLGAMREWLDSKGDRHDLARALDDAEDTFVDLGRRIEAAPDGEGVLVRYSCPQAGHALHALWCFADLARVWHEGTFLVRELLSHVALAAEAAAGGDPVASASAGREAQQTLVRVALRRMELGPNGQS